MMDLTAEMLEAGVASTVVLSPRDLTPRQLLSFGTRVLDAKGANLLDPQFYLPHEDLRKLVRHTYWPSTYSTESFWDNAHVRDLIGKLWAVNQEIAVKDFILPGLFASTVSPIWVKSQHLVANVAREIVGDLPILATFALGADLVSSNDEVERLLESAEDLNADGVYLVVQKPGDQYFSGNPNWLANLLDIIAGLRLSGRRVLVGYANQELLFCGAAGANAIASGTWMNVRNFPLSKFREAEEEMRMRATWFYDAKTFSEFKVPTLDIAQKQGLLSRFKPVGALANSYGESLFFGGQPTTAGFREREAFRHYLFCLGAQCMTFSQSSFDAVLNEMRRSLDLAEDALALYKKQGIYDAARSFIDQVSVAKGALAAHEVSRGAVLRRRWQSIA